MEQKKKALKGSGYIVHKSNNCINNQTNIMFNVEKKFSTGGGNAPLAPWGKFVSDLVYIYALTPSIPGGGGYTPTARQFLNTHEFSFIKFFSNFLTFPKYMSATVKDGFFDRELACARSSRGLKILTFKKFQIFKFLNSLFTFLYTFYTYF